MKENKNESTTQKESLKRAASLKELQRCEKVARDIYLFLAKAAKGKSGEANKRTLLTLAEVEDNDFDILAQYTGIEKIHTSHIHLWGFRLARFFFGYTFCVAMVERFEHRIGHRKASETVFRYYPFLEDQMASNEDYNSIQDLMADDLQLKKIGAMSLGINDALIELLGALAGFTITFGSSSIIAATGLVTGTAASLAMGTTSYLTARQSEEESPLSSGYFTALTYLIVVIFFVLPFLFISNPYVAMGLVVIIALIVIVLFSFYVSVVKGQRFIQRTIEMASLSLGVSMASFLIGYLIKKIFNIDV